jgi:hypothetical protein
LVQFTPFAGNIGQALRKQGVERGGFVFQSEKSWRMPSEGTININFSETQHQRNVHF